MRSLLWILFISSSAGFLSGCTKQKPVEVPTYTVKGTVYVDGQLLKEGEIVFEAPDTMTPTAAPIKDGNYELKARAGKNRVQIKAFKKVAQTAKTDEAPAENTVNYLPDTRIPYEVKAEGENTMRFDVKSR